MRRNSPEQFSQGPHSEKPDVSKEELITSLLDFIKQIESKYILRTEETRKEFIDGLEFSDYEKILTRLNGIVRGIPIKNRNMDGEGVKLEGFFYHYKPPANNDKLKLLEESFIEAKSLENLEDKALMLSTLEAAIHPFADGNGRTARLIFSLVKDGIPSDELSMENLQKILESRDELNVNPGKIEGGIINKMRENFLKENINSKTHPTYVYSSGILEINSEIPKEKQEKFKDLYEDRGYNFFAFYKFLEEKQLLESEYVKTYFDDKSGEALRTNIELTKLIPNLSEEDIDKITDYYYEIKRQYIKTMQEVFTKPNLFDSPLKEFHNLKEYYSAIVQNPKLLEIK
jgi:Fic/DOC family